MTKNIYVLVRVTLKGNSITEEDIQDFEQNTDYKFEWVSSDPDDTEKRVVETEMLETFNGYPYIEGLG